MADKLPITITSGLRGELPVADTLAVNPGPGLGIDVITAGQMDIAVANATAINVGAFGIPTSVNGGCTVTGADLNVSTGLNANVQGGSVTIADPVTGNTAVVTALQDALELNTNPAMAPQVTNTTSASIGTPTNGMVIFDPTAAPASIYGYISGTWVDLAATGGVPTQIVVPADTTALTVGQTGYFSGDEILDPAVNSADATATFAGICLTVGAPGTIIVSGVALCDFGAVTPSAGEHAYVAGVAATGTLTNVAPTGGSGAPEFVSEIGTVMSGTSTGGLYKVVLAPKSIVDVT
ncbi:MAG: hypothetical protein GY772_17510 [bacterium]|nr:hypothetical protein [bacterium]